MLNSVKIFLVVSIFIAIISVIIFAILYRKKTKKLWMKFVMGILVCTFCGGLYSTYESVDFIKNYQSLNEITITEVMDAIRADKEDELAKRQVNGIWITGCRFGGTIVTEKGERFYFDSEKDKIIVELKEKKSFKDMERIIVRPRQTKYALCGLITESEEEDDGTVVVKMDVYRIE